VKRRVNLGIIFSELEIVGVRYEAYFEEHLGVANRNPIGE